MADDSDHGGDHFEALTSRMSEALTSVGVAVKRRQAEMELLDNTLAQATGSTSAAAKMAREKLSRTRDEHAEELELMGRAHKALDDASDDATALAQVLETRMRDIDHARTQLEELGKRAAASAAKAQELETNLETTRNQALEAKKLAEEQLQALHDDGATAKESLAETQAKLAETEAKLKESDKNLDDTQKKVVETQSKLTDSEKLVSDTERKVVDALGRLEEANARNDDTESRLKESAAKLAETEGTLKQTEGRLQDAEKLAADSDATLQDTRAKLGETEDQLKEARAKIVEAEAATTESEGKLAKVEAARATAEENLETTTQSLVQAAEKLSDAQDALATTTAELKETQASLAEKTREAEELAALMGIMPEAVPTEPTVAAKADTANADKAETDKANADKAAAEKAEADRAAAEQAEADGAVAEQAEADRAAAEQAEADRAVAEQAEADRAAAEQAEADRAAAEQADEDGAAAEQADADDAASNGTNGQTQDDAPADWGDAVDGPMPPPGAAPQEVPPATDGANKSNVDAELAAYLAGGAPDASAESDAAFGGGSMFKATQAIDAFDCVDAAEVKLAGALQLQAWKLAELVQLSGLGEPAVREKLQKYVDAGLVEVTHA